jgi:hypothetical protein
MYSAEDLHKGGVSPFGHPRINDRSHLPAAYRSVPRPSSPLGAKASTERPSFTQIFHRPHAGPTRQSNQAPAQQHPHVQSDSSNTETLSLLKPQKTTRHHATPAGNHSPEAVRQPIAHQGYSTHQIIFTCQRSQRNHHRPRALAQDRNGLFPEDDAAQAGARRGALDRKATTKYPIPWLGDGRYRTDDPLLAKQALSH